jgi:hypothetical protein
MDDLQTLCDTGLAHRTQTVEEAAADQGALGAERNGFQHVLSAADAAIQPRCAARPRVRSQERRDRRGRSVELTASMVGDDQRVGAAIANRRRSVADCAAINGPALRSQTFPPRQAGPDADAWCHESPRSPRHIAVRNPKRVTVQQLLRAPRSLFKVKALWRAASTGGGFCPVKFSEAMPRLGSSPQPRTLESRVM